MLGDAEATPIGKIANKAFADQGIMEKVNVVARSATAPAVANALIMGECDAVIVWKENAGDKAIEVVDTADMDPYIKTIPAASLSFTKDETARNAFLDFLRSDTAKKIWTSYGYETLNKEMRISKHLFRWSPFCVRFGGGAPRRRYPDHRGRGLPKLPEALASGKCGSPSAQPTHGYCLHGGLHPALRTRRLHADASAPAHEAPY